MYIVNTYMLLHALDIKFKKPLTVHCSIVTLLCIIQRSTVEPQKYEPQSYKITG